MNVVFDTSSVIPLLVNKHPKHKDANKTFIQLKADNADLFITSHSTAEIFRTLTWGHSYLNFSAKKALQAIQQSVIPTFGIVNLTKTEYLYVIDWLARLNLKGAIVYDALISKATSVINANYLVTSNAKDFNRILPEKGAELIVI